MCRISRLARLETIFGLKPIQTELFLNIVNHHSFSLAGFLFLVILGRRVRRLELEVIVTTLGVLAAIGLPKDGEFLVLDDREGIREKLVARNGILIDLYLSFNSWIPHRYKYRRGTAKNYSRSKISTMESW